MTDKCTISISALINMALKKKKNNAAADELSRLLMILSQQYDLTIAVHH